MQLWQAKAAKTQIYKNQYSHWSYIKKRNSTLKETKLKKEIIFVIQLQVNAENACQALSILSQAIHHLPFGMLL